METASVDFEEKLEEDAIEDVDNRLDHSVMSGQQSLRHVVNPFLVFSLSVFGASTLLFGFDNNVISPIAALEPFVSKYQGINPVTGTYAFTARNQDLIFAVPLIGTIIGAWAASTIQFKFGRKWAITGCYIVSIGGVLLQLFAKNLGMFVAGRAWNGVGYGCAMAISPLYLSEVVPAFMRGRAVASQNIFTIFSGVIATVIVNATSGMKGKVSYMIPLAVQCAIPVILVPFTAMLPESPVWLVSKGRVEEARHNLRKLRGYSDEEVEQELQLIERSELSEREIGKDAKFSELFNRQNLKRTVTASSLLSMNQVSGVILSTTYSTIFLEQIGVNNPFQLTVASACCQLAGALIGPFVVDSAGRRPVALVGMTLLMVIDFVAGGLAFKETSSKSISLAIAILSFIFNVIWTASFYGLSLVVPSEVANVRLRNLTMSYTVGWCQTTAVITSLAVPQITSAGAGNLGAKAYLLFGGCMACIIIFTFFMIPETKGLTFPQIDEMYEKGVPAWRWNSEQSNLTNMEEKVATSPKK
ncbi:general substrate transporter [Lipomyces kononenkoae]|uniref:General substrate transporter n=1 Tax=Lipomyces kononenkoae TaxID=34357 RepID=A0ACC3SZW2_LIPKO